MKKIKNLALSIIGATLVTASLFSCSSEEMNHQQESKELNSNLQSRAATTSDEGYSYALSFYSGDISLGRSVDLVDPDTNEGVTVTEVTVYGDSRARGYIVNKLENNDFLYFADVDRSLNKLTTFEKATSEIFIFENLTESPDYITTNKFDFIEFSPEYVTYGSGCSFWKKIWGTCESYSDPDDLGNGQCGQYHNVTKYRLGKVVSTEGSNYVTGPCSEMH